MGPTRAIAVVGWEVYRTRFFRSTILVSPWPREDGRGGVPKYGLSVPKPGQSQESQDSVSPYQKATSMRTLIL